MTDDTSRMRVHAAAGPARYALGAVLIHWITAAAFAVQLGLGWRMDAPRGPETFAVYQLHKSIGITILLLTLLRIAWRLVHPAPPLAPTLAPIERWLARIVHIGFYVLLLGLPLSGWLLVSTSPRAIATILYGILPWPSVPVPAGARAAVNGAAGAAHHLLALSAMLLIILHVAGALKHQLFDRDDELGRMLPVPRRWLVVAAIVLPLMLVALMATGRNIGLRPSARPAATAPASALAPAAVRAAPAVQPTPTPTPTAAPSAIAAAATPARWTVRPGASLKFRTRWSQGAVEGGFRTWTADIVFDPEALDRSTVTVTIDMASVTAADGGQQSALPGDDWFATAAHPKAVFRASRFRALGGDRYRADGTLTLRGATRPQAVTFTLRIAGDVATMTGQASIDRVAFGVGQGEWASTADLPAGVAVAIALKADRRAAAGR